MFVCIVAVCTNVSTLMSLMHSVNIQQLQHHRSLNKALDLMIQSLVYYHLPLSANNLSR